MVKKQKNLTIDDLASMMNSRFSETEERLEIYIDTRIEDLATTINHSFTGMQKHVDQRFDGVALVQKDMLEEMTAMHSDIRYLRNTQHHHIQNEIAQGSDVADLKIRVRRLERKAGIAK